MIVKTERLRFGSAVCPECGRRIAVRPLPKWWAARPDRPWPHAMRRVGPIRHRRAEGVGRMTRFLGDILTAGLAVTEQTAPEDELRARRGVILGETTITMTYETGAVNVLGRGWIILDHDGRTFVLSDQQVHACTSDGCVLCPRRDRPALTRAIHRALAEVARRTTTHNWDDKAAHDRIRTLVRALRSI